MSRAAISRWLAEYIAERNSVYIATASADGQPYVQHRGGPKGFIRVLNDSTLAFTDLEGNRQYITVGNLAENPKAFIFMMDYANRRRVKFWGNARVNILDGQRSIFFQVERWDLNCPQHIPRKFDERDVVLLLESAHNGWATSGPMDGKSDLTHDH